MAYQGRYQVINTPKYLGNAHNVVYRSSWEKRFFIYCDTNPAILKWASEEFSIPYLSPIDNQVHRYFPDVWMEAQTPTGPKGYLIEIKPKSQTELKPVKRKTRKYLKEAATVAINHAKWNAARAFCVEHNWTFVVVTEDTLFNRRPSVTYIGS